MDAERMSIAQMCLDAAHDGSLSFPEILGKLLAADFEGYTVDYRRNSQTFYLQDGDSVVLDMRPSAGVVAEDFNAALVEKLVRWAQSNERDYSYKAFSEKAKEAGCAGYLVSLPGRRVVYFGRTAEIHVEYFPG